MFHLGLLSFLIIFPLTSVFSHITIMYVLRAIKDFGLIFCIENRYNGHLLLSLILVDSSPVALNTFTCVTHKGSLANGLHQCKKG